MTYAVNGSRSAKVSSSTEPDVVSFFGRGIHVYTCVRKYVDRRIVVVAIVVLLAGSVMVSPINSPTDDGRDDWDKQAPPGGSVDRA